MSERCEQACCEEPGISCLLNDDEETEFHFCAAHCYQNGFCFGCGNFWGGVEDFEFNNPAHLCSNCRTDPDFEEDAADGGSYYEPPLYLDEEA